MLCSPNVSTFFERNVLEILVYPTNHTSEIGQYELKDINHASQFLGSFYKYLL